MDVYDNFPIIFSPKISPPVRPSRLGGDQTRPVRRLGHAWAMPGPCLGHAWATPGPLVGHGWATPACGLCAAWEAGRQHPSSHISPKFT